MATPINHTEQMNERLLTQYKSASNLIAILGSFIDQSQDMEDALQEFYTELALATASGQQLDNLGVLLDVSRRAFDDDTYRVLLYTKIVQIFSEGTINEIIAIFKVLMGADYAELQETPPAKFTLTAVNPDPLSTIALIEASIDAAKVAGVGIGYVAATTSPAFAFLENVLGSTSGFMNIVPGEAAVTVQKQRIYFDPYPPDAGAWSLSWDGNVGSPALAYNSVAADVQTHLRNITGLGSVTVTGSFASGYFEVDMVGVTGDEPELIEINTNTLTQSGSPLEGIVVEQAKISSGEQETGGVMASIYETESLFTPLDLSPTAAFATHRLRTCQSDYVMQVRRVVAGDTVDVYDFNRSTMEYKLAETGSWIDGAGETFYLVQLYDQSGNSRHLKQTLVPSAQPQVIINDRNGFPTINYDGSNDCMRTDQNLDTMCSVSTKTLYAASKPLGSPATTNPWALPLIMGDADGYCVLTQGNSLVGGGVDRIWADHFSTVEEWAKSTYTVGQWNNFALRHGSGRLSAYKFASEEEGITVTGNTQTLASKLATGITDYAGLFFQGAVTHYYVFDVALLDDDHQKLSDYTDQF